MNKKALSDKIYKFLDNLGFTPLCEAGCEYIDECKTGCVEKGSCKFMQVIEQKFKKIFKNEKM